MQIQQLLVARHSDLLLTNNPEHDIVSVRGAGLRLQKDSILKR